MSSRKVSHLTKRENFLPIKNSSMILLTLKYSTTMTKVKLVIPAQKRRNFKSTKRFSSPSIISKWPRIKLALIIGIGMLSALHQSDFNY